MLLKISFFFLILCGFKNKIYIKIDDKSITQKEFEIIESAMKITLKGKVNDSQIKEYTIYSLKDSLLKEKFLETMKAKIECKDAQEYKFKLSEVQKKALDKLNCVNSIWNGYLYSVASSKIDLKGLSQDELMKIMSDENTSMMRKVNEMFLVELSE